MQGFTAPLERQLARTLGALSVLVVALFVVFFVVGMVAGKRAADRWYAKHWQPQSTQRFHCAYQGDTPGGCGVSDSAEQTHYTTKDGRVEFKNNAGLNRLVFDTGTTGAGVTSMPGIGETFPAVSIARRDGTAYWKCPLGWNLVDMHIDGRKDLTLHRCALPGWGE